MTVSRRWIKGMHEDLSTIPYEQLGKKVADWVLQETRSTPGCYGLNLHFEVVNQPDVLCELVKIHIFLSSRQNFFARSVKLSKNQKQLLFDIVVSDPNRSRNYLARKAGDAANIPYDIVQLATSFSVAFNVGNVGYDGIWYPPIPVSFPDNSELLEMFQLLVIIFTLERAYPLFEYNGQHWFVRVKPFNTVGGAIFVANVYSYHLLKRLIMV